MSKTDLRRLTGGMNQDLDPEFIPEGDYIEAWNCTGYRDVNTYGRLYNLKGTEANAFALPSGGQIYTILGIAEDRPNHKLYYFIYGDSPSNWIIEFNIHSKVNTSVCSHVNLGFSSTKRIDAIVESGVLIWVDDNVDSNYIGPKRLEIQRAINTQGGLGAPDYPAWTPQVFDCVWYPPNERPIIAFGSETTRETNNIQKKVFQFSYRYVYYDKGRSVFGPYSKILIPTGEEDRNGTLIENATVNNKIVVQCHEGVPDLVIKVELFVREFRTDNAVGYWRLCKTFIAGVDTPVGNYFSFNFVNDRSQQIDIDQSLRPHDYIPTRAKCVTTVRDSQVVFGNYTDGKDQVNPDITLGHTHYTMGNLVGAETPFTLTQIEESFEYDRDPQLIYENVFIKIDQVILTKAYYITYGGSTYTYTPTGGDTTEDIVDAFINLMVADGIQAQKESSTEIWLEQSSIDGHKITAIVGNLPTTGSVEKQLSWKKGAFIPLGILYRDVQGRPFSVAQNPSTVYRLPFSTEEKEDGTLVDNLSNPITTPDYYTKLDFTIAHLPPEQASTWQWVYLKNNLAFYQTYLCKAVKIITEAGADPRIGFDVNSFVIANNAVALKTRLKPYEFTEGDRLRVIAHDGDTLLSTYLDFAINGIHTESDINNNSVEYVLVDNFDFASYSLGMGATVEIYRHDYEVFQSEDSETPIDYDEQWRIHYFELGEVYDIYDSGGTKYHRGETQDQTGAQDAEGQINGGDCYQRIRFYLNSSFYAECDSISDFYDSKVLEKGRLAMSLKDMAETTYPNGIYHGGQNQSIHDDTNFMFSFDYDGWTHEIPKEYGSINKLISIGDILKVLQESKISSVYIGRDSAITADGEQILRTTDKVLGSIRPSIDEYGTVFPTSIITDGSSIYFFDIYKKAFVVNSPAGNEDLAHIKYGMNSFFIETCNTLLSRNLSDISVFTAIDRYGYVVLTIKDATAGSTINWSILWDPMNKRWKSLWSDPPDYMAGWEKLVSFIGGDLYLHNEDDDNPGLIFGSQATQSLKVVATPKEDVIFLSVFLETNHNQRLESVEYTLPGDQALLDAMWSSENKGDLLIPATQADIHGRQTRLKPLRWTRRQDRLICPIPPDLWSPRPISDAPIVASGSIVNGTEYHIDYDTVTYDGTTYQIGDTFTGGAVTTYTGSGYVREVSVIEELSLDYGRNMRGRYMFVTLRNQADVDVWIKSVGINYIKD